jgi:hypothetical protein
MKTRNILLLAGVGYLAWLYFRNKKKPLKAEDLSAGKNGSPAPLLKGNGAPEAPTSPALKQPITVDDLSMKVTPVFDVQPMAMPILEKPALREPIVMPATNLIPNTYDRGVGQPLPMNDQYYASFAGVCSENIESACKCAGQRKEKYKLDIPKLP